LHQYQTNSDPDNVTYKRTVGAGLISCTDFVSMDVSEGDVFCNYLIGLHDTILSTI